MAFRTFFLKTVVKADNSYWYIIKDIIIWWQEDISLFVCGKSNVCKQAETWFLPQECEVQLIILKLTWCINGQ